MCLYSVLKEFLNHNKMKHNGFCNILDIRFVSRREFRDGCGRRGRPRKTFVPKTIGQAKELYRCRETGCGERTLPNLSGDKR